MQPDTNRTNKDSLKATALTQRIAQIVAQYEDQMAEFRAESTITVESLQSDISGLRQQVQDLVNELTALKSDEGDLDVVQAQEPIALPSPNSE